MKIAIHYSKGSFSDRWIAYCESAGISYKIINCYKNSILEDIADCDALMWHFHHNSPKAKLCAKQILISLKQSGRRVFPDFNTMWHFDDKLGQKYLLESIDAPLVPTWVFYDREEATRWAENVSYPKVFKLRAGAGSHNVRLVRNSKAARRLIRKAFNHGFSLYDPLGSLRERWRLFRLNKTNLLDIFEGVLRFVVPPPFARLQGHERGYVYFQEFIANNDHDIRVIVIGDKAFAIKRLVRKGDFRASGSGFIFYEKELFDIETLRLSFELAEKLKTQCLVLDYVYKNGQPFVLEISYGFTPEGYDACPGYWDKNLIWHERRFNPYGWMVEHLINEI